jgi:Na+/H+-dicarboxylate symporter
MKIVAGLILIFIFGAIFYVLGNIGNALSDKESSLKEKLFAIAISIFVVYLLLLLADCTAGMSPSSLSSKMSGWD